MAIKICNGCKKEFRVKPSHYPIRKFCSFKCRNDDYKLRKLSKTHKHRISLGMLRGNTRKHRKVVHHNGRQKLNSHIVWCSNKDNLPYIPKGFEVHHIDLNPLNDSYSNLIMLDRKTHRLIHDEINRRRKIQ